MYICLNCEHLFERPERWEERHGLDSPPYEVHYGCPKCFSSYAETYQCENCGQWIMDTYVKVGDQRYCQDCYQVYELGDED